MGQSVSERAACDHVMGLVTRSPRDGYDGGYRLAYQGSPEALDEPFNFCPLCGLPLPATRRPSFE